MGHGNNLSGHRLAFLIIESEPAQGLSTRKLLLESAKHNVITAYSAEEGEQMFRRFHNVDVVCIDTEFNDRSVSKLVEEIKGKNSNIRILALTPRIAAHYEWADEVVNSHDPAALLKCLERLGGRTDI
jgi:DNA-binding response OmpR family regulator